MRNESLREAGRSPFQAIKGRKEKTTVGVWGVRFRVWGLGF